jgi:transcriptional regulator with XRE-family HTH domain
MQGEHSVSLPIGRFILMGKHSRPQPRRLPKKLRLIRDALGLSQSQILKEMGLDDKYTRNNLSNYETGKRETPWPIQLGYARLADISVDLLLDDKLELPDHLVKPRASKRRSTQNSRSSKKK